jgi:hypothetical protein
MIHVSHFSVEALRGRIFSADFQVNGANVG